MSPAQISVMVRKSERSSMSTPLPGLFKHSSRSPFSSSTIHQCANWERPLKKEFDHGPAAGELRLVDPPAKIVHEKFHVEFVIAHLATGPLHPPLAQADDDRQKFPARGSEVVFGPPLLRQFFPDDQPAILQLIEPLGQERGRDLRQGAL
jgi:hypothetical protein